MGRRRRAYGWPVGIEATTRDETTRDAAADDELTAARWRAVEARDASAAGLFVYAVRTTGVYCRPGCSARRPLRANVEFFATPSLASSAGYRACRRCRPDADAAAGEAQPGRGDGDRHGTELAAVVATCRHLEACGDASDLVGLARRLGWSEGRLRRLFSTHVGVPVGAYLQAQRAEAAREALRSGRSVAEAVYDAGYGSSRAFYEHGAARLGMAPARYRRGGEGVGVAYTVVASALGRLLVAATERGVCAVRFAGDDAGTGSRGANDRPERIDEELVEELARELPSAVLVRDDAGLAALSRVVVGAVRGVEDATALPVDLAGTAFQARVWAALRAIPAGETRTYGELAAAVGQPSAVRAVAGACAANPAAVVVPCHRVVPKAGGVGGYRWGPSVKQALLDAEGAELAGRA